MSADGETLPETITWKGNLPKGKMVLLANGKKVKYRTEGDLVTVTLPKGLEDGPLAFRFELKNK